MTSPRRLEQDLPALLADLYLAGTPDYRDDLVRGIAATRQRPAWTFLERWLPMDIATQRVPVTNAPWRTFGVLALIGLLLATAAAVYIGARSRVPDPFGPAANGAIVYGQGGDVYVRDSVTANARVLVGGATDDHDPGFSPDGSRLLFVRTIDGDDHLMMAADDGTDAVQLVRDPLVNAYVAWSPDSRSIALTNEVDGLPHLSIVPVDGRAPIAIDLGDVVPTDLAWRPPLGGNLLIRGVKKETDKGRLFQTIDFYLVNADGTGLRALGLPSHERFGLQWDNSGPAWSLDGSTIAYNVVEEATVPQGGHFRVHLVNADGSGDRALPGPPDALVQEAWPIFSPDGTSILVHRWTWKSDPSGGEGWLAILPADGSAPARDIGPRVPGGEDTGLIKSWSPDGTRVLVRADNTRQVFSIDPVTGSYESLAWEALSLPDWQRRAP